VPWSLKRSQQSGQNIPLTFRRYHRQPKLGTAAARNLFVRALETVRQHDGLLVDGFVVMLEHVHLLVSEPEKGRRAQALQSLKQSVARKLALRATEPFWQARSYDFKKTPAQAELERGTLES
jgi:putative transposase